MKAVVASPAAKAGMPQAGGEKRPIGGHAECDGLIETANELAPCLVAGHAVADEFRNHRIIERRNLGTGLQRMLDAKIIRHLPQRHPAGLRHEIMAGILRTQPYLDGVTGKLNIFLLKSERLAAGDAQLQFDEIKPGDRLGDGMLDLQAGIHFHEIEFAFCVEQELERAGALISDRLDRGDRDRPHPRPQFRRHRR